MTLSDCFTLCGAIASTVAIIVALRIASSQERKNRKRIEEENKNIGETICALIQQLSSLLYIQTIKGYQVCIEQLEKDETSQPKMNLIPMTGIKKLGQFSPDILYRVFKYYKLTSEDYRYFVLYIDRVTSYVETGVENYKNADSNVVKLKNEFQENFKEFNTLILSLLQEYERDNKINNPVYIGISKILDPFINSKESENYDNIRFRKNELVDKIREYVASRTQDNKEFMNIYIMALNLETIYTTLITYNKLYAGSLRETKTAIIENMVKIMEIHDKLEKQCK